MQGQFHARNSMEYRQNAKQVYKDHYAEIRDALKDQPERLLEFKLEDGWHTLCKFLDEPVPDVPFPHVNEGAEHEEMLGVVYLKFARDALGLVLRWMSPFVVALVAWRLWPRSR